AEFVLTVKQNQPTLLAAIDALPWADTPITHRHVDRAHGRITTRTIQTLPAPTGLPFPHVNQVWLIERYVTDPTDTPRSAVAALGLTSLTDTRATPEQLASLVREHWGITAPSGSYTGPASRSRSRSGLDPADRSPPTQASHRACPSGWGRSPASVDLVEVATNPASRGLPAVAVVVRVAAPVATEIHVSVFDHAQVTLRWISMMCPVGPGSGIGSRGHEP
ncbi:MAG: hypothetical protein H0V92_03785, partial [Pseudonocardiales bacterium]|nr:hypothetical protein [Pseudonocardiales bacterium]